MSKQSRVWAGKFGDAYTKRNRDKYLEIVRERFWKSAARLYGVKGKILELGCGDGKNLMHLGPESEGVDINQSAVNACREKGLNVKKMEVQKFLDCCALNEFDWIVTCGFLIHVDPLTLPNLLDKMCWVANEGMVIMEYHSAGATVAKSYRRRKDLLWKHNFEKVLAKKGWASVVKRGYLAREEGFDRLHYWVVKMI